MRMRTPIQANPSYRENRAGMSDELLPHCWHKPTA